MGLPITEEGNDGKRKRWRLAFKDRLTKLAEVVTLNLHRPRAKPTVTYRLRFAADLTPRIRSRVWHPTQRLEELPGNGVELTFTCAESLEVNAWVASWRNGVQVVEPAALRDELAELGKWLVGEYASDRVQRR